MPVRKSTGSQKGFPDKPGADQGHGQRIMISLENDPGALIPTALYIKLLKGTVKKQLCQ